MSNKQPPSGRRFNDQQRIFAFASINLVFKHSVVDAKSPMRVSSKMRLETCIGVKSPTENFFGLTVIRVRSELLTSRLVGTISPPDPVEARRLLHQPPARPSKRH